MSHNNPNNKPTNITSEALKCGNSIKISLKCAEFPLYEKHSFKLMKIGWWKFFFLLVKPLLNGAHTLGWLQSACENCTKTSIYLFATAVNFGGFPIVHLFITKLLTALWIEQCGKSIRVQYNSGGHGKRMVSASTTKNGISVVNKGNLVPAVAHMQLVTGMGKKEANNESFTVHYTCHITLTQKLYSITNYVTFQFSLDVLFWRWTIYASFVN